MSFAYTIADKGQEILNGLSENELQELSKRQISKKAPKKDIDDLPTWCASHSRMRLLGEWHPENPDKPEDHRASDGDQVKWKCHICGHIWTCSINSRTTSKHDCEECHRRSCSVTTLTCLRAVRDVPGITAAKLSELCEKPIIFVMKKLKQLSDDGKISRIRIGKNFVYNITEEGIKEIELFSKLGMDIGPLVPSNEKI